MTEFLHHTDSSSPEQSKVIDISIQRDRFAGTDRSRPVRHFLNNVVVFGKFSQYNNPVVDITERLPVVVEVDSSMQNTDIQETDSLDLETDEL